MQTVSIDSQTVSITTFIKYTSRYCWIRYHTLESPAYRYAVESCRQA